MERHTVVAVGLHLLRVTREWSHVVSAGENPQRLVQVEERVGVSIGPEEHALPWALVDRRDRPRSLEDRAVARLATDAVLLDEPDGDRQNLLDVASLDDSHSVSLASFSSTQMMTLT